MAKTFDVGSSTLVTFPVTSGNVDLAAYNAFVKETLKPTSDTLVAFRSRAVKPASVVSLLVPLSYEISP